MNNCGPLLGFGIAICVVASLCIIIPFLRGKSDVPTAWNCLLIGLIIFTGFGSIELTYVNQLPFEQLNWFQPTSKEVQWYMLMTTAFIAALLFAYYLNTPATRFAQRRLQKWPEFNIPVSMFVLISCLSIVLISFVVGRFVFFGPAFFKFGHKAAVFACVFSFMLWNRNRVNVTWLILFVGVLGFALIYCMMVSQGRRLVMSVFLGPILCLYWTRIRSWKPTRILMSMAIAGCIMVSVAAVYSKFRWYNLATGEQRSVSGLVSQIKDIGAKGDYLSTLVNSGLGYFSQQNGHFALLAERYVAQGALTATPLNTLQFVLAYPVPRRIWPGKPEVVAILIARDASHIPNSNWGVGIAGHGAYEGGSGALVLYAVLIAFLVRLIDEPLLMQPTNPFLIAIHAAALPHVLSIPRGDIGVLVVEISECILFAVILGFVSRAIFGTQRRISHLTPQWPNTAVPAYRLSRYPHVD